MGPAAAAALFAAAAGLPAAAARANWYDGLDGVKVLHPGDPRNQGLVNNIARTQYGGQFNGNRYAILLTAGDHKGLDIPVGFYTAVYGVAGDPRKVRLRSVHSHNGLVGGATQNFWRSCEGVTLWQNTVWAVSQAAPMRRSVLERDLYLSDSGGWSSGGFLADVKVHGTVDTGTQQQWFFRNVDFGALRCSGGWNFVFMGQRGLSSGEVGRCDGGVPSKVSHIGHTPRIAEKPYLVLEDDRTTWRIYVPKHKTSAVGATADYADSLWTKLDVDTEVFVAKPGHTAADINRGTVGKRGLLVTPGVYRLSSPVAVRKDGFIVLGIGFPTLIATAGLSAIRVADGLTSVRIAGLLLEAGTVQEERFRMIRSGTCGDMGQVPIHTFRSCKAAARDLKLKVTKVSTTHALGVPEGCYYHQQRGKSSLFLALNRRNRGKGAMVRPGAYRLPLCAAAVGGATHPLLAWGTGAASGRFAKRQGNSGVLSDIFARVGSFRYQGCRVVRADAMLEINGDDVILDNTWLWHADHDDCGQLSNSCHSAHGLVVNGHRVTSYGLAAEHNVAGDIVSWAGEDGETYFFQCELPYDTPSFAKSHYAGYSVAPHVRSHTAVGLGVYIIGALSVKCAYIFPPHVVTHNLITIVIGPNSHQFHATACVRGDTLGAGWACHAPRSCSGMRCALATLPNSPAATAFLQ